MRFIAIILLLLVAILFGSYCLSCVKQGTSISGSGFLLFCRDCWDRLCRALKAFGRKDNALSGSVPIEKYVAMKERCLALEQEKERALADLSRLERDWNSKYDALRLKLDLAQKGSEELASKNSALQEKVQALKTVARKLYPVSEESVSRPFCQSFQNLDHLILNSFATVVEILNSLEGDCTIPVFEYISAYLEKEESLSRSLTMKWHSLLLTSSAVTAEAASDIENKNDEEILDYLRRVSFEQYFRPKIAAVVLLFEHIRASLSGRAESSVRSVIEDFLSTLRSYDIDVSYCMIGCVLENVNYKDYEIHIPDTAPVGALKNTVVDALNYGVNCKLLDCVGDKTIVEMII